MERLESWFYQNTRNFRYWYRLMRMKVLAYDMQAVRNSGIDKEVLSSFLEFRADQYLFWVHLEDYRSVTWGYDERWHQLDAEAMKAKMQERRTRRQENGW
jgi:hypothetical protein